MANAIIATVTSISVRAQARNAEGELRELKVGDKLLEGETLVTPNGGRVELSLSDGNPLVVSDVPEMAITRDLVAETAAGADESAVEDETVQQVLAALDSGEDLGDVLSAPAAGPGPGPAAAFGLQAADGHSFIRLSRILESTDEFTGVAGGVAAENLVVDDDPTLLIPEPVAPPPPPIFPPPPPPAPPTVSVGPVQGDAVVVTEGTDAYAVFQVSLSNPSASAMTFDLALMNGTALTPADYVGMEVSTDGGANWTVATSVTFAAGATSVLVRTAITDDNVAEPTEGFTLKATEQVVGSTSNGSADSAASILDDDKPRVSVGPVQGEDLVVTEGTDAYAVFQVSLSNPSASAMTFDLALMNGTALTPADYVGMEVSTDGGANWTVATSVTFAAGATSVLVRTAITDDNVAEPTEGFTLKATEQVVGSTSNGSADSAASILDDDKPRVSVGPVQGEDLVVTEGTDAYAVFQVSLSNPSASAMTFDLALMNGTALTPADYVGMEVSTDGGANWTVATSVTFAAGATSVLVRTAITDDNVAEPTEGFTLKATEQVVGSTSNGSADSAASILDDDKPRVSVGPVQGEDLVVTEGTDAYAVFQVSLSNPSASAMTFDLALMNGTALTPADYVGMEVSTDGGANWTVATSVTFAAGATSVLVRTAITDDNVAEPTEGFTLKATEQVVGSTSNGSADSAASILDDDKPTVSVGPVQGDAVVVTEGTDAYAVFQVSLSNPSASAMTFDLALMNGTALTPADYVGMEVSTDGGANWTVATSVTFAAGATSVLVRTAITDDNVAEPTEGFTLKATEQVVGSTSNGSADSAASILDDDKPRVSVGPVQGEDLVVTEGTDAYAVFQVSLSNPSASAMTFDLALMNGTALTPADYVGMEVSTDGGANWTVATSVTFAAGATSVLVRTAITDDNVAEPTEGFTLKATEQVVGSTSNGSADSAASILDDDKPRVSVGPVQGEDLVVTEGTDAYAVFQVSLSNPSASAMTFDLALMNGTALTPADYVGMEVSTDGGANWTVATSVTFAAGATSVLVRTAITDDNVAEPTEGFTLKATEQVVGSTSNGSADSAASILDDDKPRVSVGPVQGEDLVVTEGTDAYAVFQVSLSNPSASAMTFDLALMNGTALTPADYVGMEVSTDGGANWTVATSVTFAAGATSVLVRTAITDDNVAEPTEGFTLKATEQVVGSTSNGSADSAASILDDDKPTVSVGPVQGDAVVVTEGTDAYAVFQVSLSNPSASAMTFDLALMNGTALTPADYVGMEVSTDGGANWTVATSVTFAAGATSVLVRTAITDDNVAEPTEGFTLKATEQVVGSTSNGSADSAASILDDDKPRVSVGPVQGEDLVVTEGTDAYAVFQVSLSNPSASAMTFDLALMNGTALTPADYVGMEVSTDGGANWTVATSVTFAAGATSVLVRTAITDDNVAEPTEGFTLKATEQVVGSTSNGSADSAASILDDDKPRVSVGPVQGEDLVVTEGTDAYAVFQVSLSNPSASAMTFDLALMNGTALTPADYVGMEVSTDGGANWTVATSVTFAAGATSVLVRTAITDDNVAEPTEGFTLKATEQVVGSTSNGSADSAASILDDDKPRVSVGPVQGEDLVVTEGTDAYAVFQVSLSNPSASAMTFDLALMNGTALTPADYVGMEVSTDGGANWTVATSVTFAAGATSVLVRTAITDDNVAEPTEGFTLKATEQVVGSTSNGSADSAASILDDDKPRVSVGPVQGEDLVVTEGTDAYAVFQVSLSNPSASAMTFDLALMNGTALTPADYVGMEVSTDGGANWTVATSVTFAAGATSVLVRTAITDDNVAEPTEGFTLKATEQVVGSTSNGSADSAASILDDDKPRVSVGPVQGEDLVVTEGTDAYAVFQVSLSNPSASAMTFDLALMNGTALTPADYVGLQVSADGINWSAATAVTFAAGATSMYVRTAITDDAFQEKTEGFTLKATEQVVGSTSNGNAQSAATILDDDSMTLNVLVNGSVDESLLDIDNNGAFADQLWDGSNAQSNPVTTEGTITYQAFGPVTFKINGQTLTPGVGQTVDGEHGIMTITAVDATDPNGVVVVSYSYELLTAEGHDGAPADDDGKDIFDVVVMNSGGQIQKDLEISITDDTPVAYDPADSVVVNGQANSGPHALNFYANAGADGPELTAPGAVLFTISQGATVITVGGKDLYLDGAILTWDISANGTVATATTGSETAFVVTISGDTYTVSNVNSGVFSVATDNVPYSAPGGVDGGNALYFGILNLGGSDVDVVLSAEKDGVPIKVNTTSSDIGTANQWIDAREKLYFDFYSDSTLNSNQSLPPAGFTPRGINNFKFEIYQGGPADFKVVMYLEGGGTEEFDVVDAAAGDYITATATSNYVRIEIIAADLTSKFSIQPDSFTDFNPGDVSLSLDILGSDADGDTQVSTIDFVIDQADGVTPPAPASFAAAAADDSSAPETVIHDATEDADTLVASHAPDVFVWSLADNAPEGDHVVGFNPVDDVINIADLLGDSVTQADISSYLNVTEEAGSTVIRVSTAGAVGDTNQVDQIITLDGVDFADLGLDANDSMNVIIQDMVTAGKLITD